jgi:hypothetical protein
MLIGLTGYAGSGKDTVAEFLVKEHGFVRYAFADKMREALERLNPFVSDCGLSLEDILANETWDEAKRHYPEVRELLQRFGTEVGRTMFGEDFWINLAYKQWRADGFHKDAVFTDVRFPNEGEWIMKMGGVLCRVDRPGVGPVNGHSSESQKFGPGIPVIANNGGLDNLQAEVAEWVEIFSGLYR